MAEIPKQSASRHEAMQKVRRAQSFSVDLPLIGRVPLPRPEQLAFYGALGVLAAVEIIEWPVALRAGPFEPAPSVRGEEKSKVGAARPRRRA